MPNLTMKHSHEDEIEALRAEDIILRRASMEKDKKIAILREFTELVKHCPPGELHLLPLAADALLSELGE